MLRALRTERGWTVEQVAEQLLVSPSKVSRLETGQRGASPRDIRDLCDLYGVTADQRQVLADLAAEGKQRAWWQPFDLPYSTYVGLEAEAASIRDFALGIIPGLLQTADYARAAVRAAKPDDPAVIVEQLVRARLERKERLLGADTPTFTAILDESVLHRVVGSPAIMRQQLRELLDASVMRNVSLRVVPFAAGAVPSGNNKFIILNFASPAIADVVYVESLTGELILDRESDLKVYNRAYETLADMAASAGDTRAMIGSLERSYA
jgi:transcriptional regulator with XRE-family HTH domain